MRQAAGYIFKILFERLPRDLPCGFRHPASVSLPPASPVDRARNRAEGERTPSDETDKIGRFSSSGGIREGVVGPGVGPLAHGGRGERE